MKNTKGFTLIELLIAISIIGILVTLLIANLVGARLRAREANQKAELQQLKKALRLYYNDFQGYPDASANEDIVHGGTTFTEGDTFEVGGLVYMQEVPAYDEYIVTSDNERFMLKLELSNASDQDIQQSQDRCDYDPTDFSNGFDNAPTSTDYLVCN